MHEAAPQESIAQNDPVRKLKKYLESDESLGMPAGGPDEILALLEGLDEDGVKTTLDTAGLNDEEKQFWQDKLSLHKIGASTNDHTETVPDEGSPALSDDPEKEPILNSDAVRESNLDNWLQREGRGPLDPSKMEAPRTSEGIWKVHMFRNALSEKLGSLLNYKEINVEEIEKFITESIQSLKEEGVIEKDIFNEIRLPLLDYYADFHKKDTSVIKMESEKMKQAFIRTGIPKEYFVNAEKNPTNPTKWFS